MKIMNKNKGIINMISIKEAEAACREARKRARSKSGANFSVVRNGEAFNRWLKETHPEIYKKVG